MTMVFKISKNLSDQIADYLIDKVIHLEIAPGERILEQKVARELGVSRSPVREAFRILEQTGLVELIPRCGVRVTGLSEKSIDAYCDVFSLLFGHVVRR
ncbi:MAG: GntR family transcriptional regulator [Proteobacteria bacterium]|nr:GntR family transcriptional regulator [Pseudomonadota bacterium]